MTSPFGRKRKSRSRLIGLFIWPIVLVGGAAMFWKPLLVLVYAGTTGGNISMTKEVDNRPQGYFYRFKARFSHNGEPLTFDYVVACNIRITTYRGGGRSNDSTYAPKVMMKATSDGGAIMVRTVNACKGQTTEFDGVPEDLFPMAIWFDDVNDMTFGWGYATEDAYEGENSQLEFHGASIEFSNRTEWEMWRQVAASGFKPVGMIVTPWGMTYQEKWAQRYSNRPYDASRRVPARNCEGYFRIKLPENIREEIRALWPKDRPLYWSPSPKAKLRTVLDRGNFSVKTKFKHFLTGVLGAGQFGLPLRKGKGYIESTIKIPSGVYPLLPRSLSLPSVPTEPLDSYPRRILFANGKMKGFLACGGDALVDKNVSQFDPDIGKKAQPIYIDDQLVDEQYRSLGAPVFIFERDEYVFRINPAGRGSP